MFKKILNSVEILVAIIIIWTITWFYNPYSSYHRAIEDLAIQRILLDIGITFFLLMRSFILLKDFMKPWNEIKRPKWITPVMIFFFSLLILLDVIAWTFWYYYTGIFGYFLIVYLIPILLLVVEHIEIGNKTRSNKSISYIFLGVAFALLLSIGLVLLQKQQIDILKKNVESLELEIKANHATK